MRWKDYITKKKVLDFLGEIDEVSAFLVTEVYPGSVADEAGIRQGFYFLPSARDRDKDIVALRFAQGVQDFIFYDLSRKKQLVLTCKGYPFGMSLRRSVLGLCVALESGGKVDFEAAAEVIHEGDDQDFLKIAVAAGQSENVRKSAEDEAAGGLGALLKPVTEPAINVSASNDNRQDIQVAVAAEHIFMAAYLAFRGKTGEAQGILPKQHDYAAIYGFGGGVASLYYLAQGYIEHHDYSASSHDGQMEGISATAADPFDAIFMFQRAAELNPNSIRALDMLEKLTGERPVFELAEPEKFYSVYSFPAHDPQKLAPSEVRPPVSFDGAVEKLGEGEYLLVILLGMYRANGFYSRAMTLLTQLYPFIGKHFPAIHVITAYEESTPLKPHWLDGEEYARQNGVPVTILYDEDNEICEEMEVNASPHGLIIDHQGMIVHRSALDEESGYWLAADMDNKEEKTSAAILSFPSDSKS